MDPLQLLRVSRVLLDQHHALWQTAKQYHECPFQVLIDHVTVLRQSWCLPSNTIRAAQHDTTLLVLRNIITPQYTASTCIGVDYPAARCESGARVGVGKRQYSMSSSPRI